jgi:tetratricopeptide (TPR) repeat protein
MVGEWIGGVPGSVALVARRGRLWRFSWALRPARRPRQSVDRFSAADEVRRRSRFRYHLGRGRRAREAGQFERGVSEARRALGVNPGDPWAFALLGQCLQHQRVSDLAGARRALERAWSLDPTNGYFVSLLLDVVTAQGDIGACMDLLTWAWWRGAPVERWLPDGPPMPEAVHVTADANTGPAETQVAPRTAGAPARSPGSPPLAIGRLPAQAWASTVIT